MRMEYQFENFSLVVPDLALARDGASISLNPQSLSVLVYLIRNRSRVVTRDELVAEFWSRSPVGADARLNTCLRRIRAALNDGGQMPRFIRTYPRIGYRFIPPVREQPTRPWRHTAREDLKRTWPALAAGTVCLALVAIFVSWETAQTQFFGARADSVYTNDSYRIEKFGELSSNCDFDELGTGDCDIVGDGRVRIFYRSVLINDFEMRRAHPFKCQLRDRAADCAAATPERHDTAMRV